MILTREDARQIYDVIQSSRRISRISIELCDVERACHTINGINSLDDKTTIFNGEVTEHIRIPDKFTSLIAPGRISLTGSEKETDIKSDLYSNYRPEQYGFDTGIQYMSSSQFEDFWFGVAASRKKGVTWKKISEYKGVEKLSDVAKRDMIGCFQDPTNNDSDTRMVMMDSDYFIPVILDYQLYKDFNYNVEVTTMVRWWFEQALDSLA